MRDHRRWRVTARLIDHRFDAVGGEHFQRARERRLRKRMRIHTEEQRPIDARAFAIFAHGLRNRQDM